MIRLKKYFLKSLVPAIAFLLLLPSCTSKEAKMIPYRDVEKILYDFYLADGMLSDPSFRSYFSSRDSIENYIDILNEYDYSIDELEKTLRFLYMKNPDRLVKIYDRVLLRFTELESKLSSNQRDFIIPLNRGWDGKEYYHFPSGSDGESGYFTQEIVTPGNYTLRYEIMVSPSDETCDPGFFGWIVSADSAETGKKYYLPKSTYIKDGQWHMHYIHITADKKSPMLLKGYFYNHNNNSMNCYIDAMIRDIHLGITDTL